MFSSRLDKIRRFFIDVYSSIPLFAAAIPASAVSATFLFLKQKFRLFYRVFNPRADPFAGRGASIECAVCVWYNQRRVGDSLAVELPALDRSTLVRIQVSQPVLLLFKAKGRCLCFQNVEWGKTSTFGRMLYCNARDGV